MPRRVRPVASAPSSVSRVVSRVASRVLGIALFPPPPSPRPPSPRTRVPTTRRAPPTRRRARATSWTCCTGRVADPSRWLEDNASPEVEAWDRAQRALLRQVLDAVPGREALRARLDAELDLQGAPTLFPLGEEGARGTCAATPARTTPCSTRGTATARAPRSR